MYCINMQTNQMGVLTLMFVWFDAINNETRCDEKCWVWRRHTTTRRTDTRLHRRPRMIDGGEWPSSSMAAAALVAMSGMPTADGRLAGMREAAAARTVAGGVMVAVIRLAGLHVV